MGWTFVDDVRADRLLRRRATVLIYRHVACLNLSRQLVTYLLRLHSVQDPDQFYFRPSDGAACSTRRRRPRCQSRPRCGGRHAQTHAFDWADAGDPPNTAWDAASLALARSKPPPPPQNPPTHVLRGGLDSPRRPRRRSPQPNRLAARRPASPPAVDVPPGVNFSLEDSPPKQSPREGMDDATPAAEERGAAEQPSWQPRLAGAAGTLSPLLSDSTRFGRPGQRPAAATPAPRRRPRRRIPPARPRRQLPVDANGLVSVQPRTRAVRHVRVVPGWYRQSRASLFASTPFPVHHPPLRRFPPPVNDSCFPFLSSPPSPSASTPLLAPSAPRPSSPSPSPPL